MRLPIFIVLARPEAPNSPNHWTPPPNSSKESNPVRFCQSRIKDICLFYPPSFIPIPTLQVFFQDFPLQLPPMSKDLVRDLK